MRLILCSSLVLLALGCAATAQNTKPTMHDPAALASLESYVRTGMDELAKGNIAWWKQSACPQAVMWDVDPESNAITAVGKVQIDAALDGFQKMIASGAQMTTTTHSIQCRASSLGGHCLVEFDQSVTQGGKTMGPFKFRGTAIAERHGDGWIWTHWHGSLREAPAPPPAAPAASPSPAPSPAPSPTPTPSPAPNPAPSPAPAAAPAPAPAAAPAPAPPAGSKR